VAIAHFYLDNMLYNNIWCVVLIHSAMELITSVPKILFMFKNSGICTFLWASSRHCGSLDYEYTASNGGTTDEWKQR
jgi:hypothetical protein